MKDFSDLFPHFYFDQWCIAFTFQNVLITWGWMLIFELALTPLWGSVCSFFSVTSVIVHGVFTLSIPYSLSIHNNIPKCHLTLLYGVSGVCALDFVSLERGNEAETWQSWGAVHGAEKEECFWITLVVEQKLWSVCMCVCLTHSPKNLFETRKSWTWNMFSTLWPNSQ